MHPLEFDPRAFARGGRYPFDLEFDAGGERIAIPVLLLRGAEAGRTLVATAGVHGDEFEGVRTILELSRELDPAGMKGDAILAPVVNPPAFWNGTRTSPMDGMNLARTFPGRPDGTASEAIAYWLDQAVFVHSDLYVDLHSAGVQLMMPTLAGYYMADEASREAAFAFGARVVWAHPDMPPGRTLSSIHGRGKAGIYVEARGAGRVHPDDLKVYKRGMYNLLRLVGILPGEPEAAAPEFHLFGGGDLDQSLVARQAGFLIPSVSVLDRVEAGAELGRVVDLHGECIQRVTAPGWGIVVLTHEYPVVKAGEPLFFLTGIFGE
ncbi:MAG: succinylglutamate desuccinylase/aspartoacylase family protein [Acidobacteria bacterium]|nr:succinylglutamate desuccinylase/aspartoacylase family protein [Acidobacteriota bacterium]